MPERLPVDLCDAPGGQSRVDHWRYIFVGQINGPPCALDDAVGVRGQQSELDFGAPAEPLLPRPILHLEREPELMQSRVHRLVQNRCRDFGVGEVGVHREGQLHQTRTLFVKVRAPARKALYDDVGEVPFEVTEMVRDIFLDHRERSIESRQHVSSVDIWTRVIDDYWNSTHLVL
jgi:hypothetical protein